MKCTYCDDDTTKVIDSRESEGSIRRRRECQSCGDRFTTYERPQYIEVEVVKSDGSSEEFNESKLREGLQKAGKNTSIDDSDVESIVESIKKEIRSRKQISSSEIGDMIKEELSTKDEVAYIRFVSVYDAFTQPSSFVEEIEKLDE